MMDYREEIEQDLSMLTDGRFMPSPPYESECEPLTFSSHSVHDTCLYLHGNGYLHEYRCCPCHSQPMQRYCHPHSQPSPRGESEYLPQCQEASEYQLAILGSECKALRIKRRFSFSGPVCSLFHITIPSVNMDILGHSDLWQRERIIDYDEDRQQHKVQWDNTRINAVIRCGYHTKDTSRNERTATTTSEYSDHCSTIATTITTTTTTTNASPLPTTTSIILLFLLVFLSSASSPSVAEPIKVNIHALIPRHFAMTTELNREFRSTVINFKRDIRSRRLSSVFQTSEDLTFISDDTPKEILDAFCNEILAKHATTILNINNPLGLRSRDSSNEYILELAHFLGIPVISWDTQFSSEAKPASTVRSLQLAPTIEHQAMAMVSLLERYNWTTFSVVTATAGGDAEFVSAIENLVELSKKKAMLSPADAKRDSLEILSTVHIRELDDVRMELSKLVGSDTRVFLLHCNNRAAFEIMETAVRLGLTGRDYVWILTRNAIPTGKYGPDSFPVGLMGVSYEYELEAMKRVIRVGVKTWLYALLDMAKMPSVIANKTIPPQFTCDSDFEPYWHDGDVLYDHMLNVSIRDEPQIVFNENGTLTKTEVIIINLQWLDGAKERSVWKEVGRWKRNGLKMEDITWPGESSTPPTGKPKRAFLRVSTLNELPYVIYRMPKEDGECEDNSLPCWIYERAENKDLLSNVTILRCCVGLSMDLLKILSDKLNFDFEIKEVEDGKWGGLNKVSKTWNGLVKALLDDKADIVMTSFKINPERAEAVRFSVPYLETGIKIIVALREGAISPTAFLEPYDYASWSLILIFSVHATGSSILIFEWLSPYGLNRGITPMRDHKFSLFRSFWLIWAMLFSTSVQTDSPKGIASRFLANIWALFALVFLASYTANLAAFMITKEEFYDLTGIQDYRLQNPYTMNPPFKYATIPNGSTEANIRANHKDMYNYMKAYNLPDVDAGIAALKKEKIQAFIYDSSVLEYYASRDPKCRLVTVGNRYAMTGYGVGFPPNFENPWIDKINKVILKLQENGELDRLQKFWLAGACDMKKEKGVSNRTLGILNFTSAFILLGSGVLLGLLILIFEHIYFKFGRQHLRKWDRCGCCALVSLSMGKSLQLKDYVDEAMQAYTRNRCRDPVCETQIWKLRHQLDMALLKIDNLHNQLSGTTRGELQLTPTTAIELEVATHRPQNAIAHRANGTRPSMAVAPPPRGSNQSNSHSKPTTPASSKQTYKKTPAVTDVPVVKFGGKNARDSGDMVDKFEKFLESYDKSDTSPSVDHFSDPLLPPPPLGESPLLGSSSAGGSYDMAPGLGSFGGDTYIGFDDFSSDAGSARSGSGLAVAPGGVVSGNSPAHMLRRTPSYTSAVGGNLTTDLVDDSSPAHGGGRVRQFEGKKYVGVDSHSPKT